MGVAVGSAGVLLAVQARSALGQTICQSPSAMVSGNASPHPDQAPCSGGRSPGFWKQPQHFPEWTDAEYPTFTVDLGECPTGKSDLTSDVIATPGTLVTTVLPNANVPPNTGIWEVLAFPTDFGSLGQLMRHLICAWLNASRFDDYPITRSQVQDMWLAVANGGLYCPSSIVCNESMGMDATEVKNYIESMYDYNAEIEKKVCKANDDSGSSSTSNGSSGPGGGKDKNKNN
jgi:hypothetical protein